jgi:hypothetical protein
MKYTQPATALALLASSALAAECKPKVDSESLQADIKTEK